MFLTDDGRVFGVGKGEYGQLGIGTFDNASVATAVEFDAADLPVVVVGVSCGGYVLFALNCSPSTVRPQLFALN